MSQRFFVRTQSDRAVWRHTKRTWRTCERCSFGSWACKKVFGRGVIPADLCFVGEAPGRNEDATGLPFVGRAGKLLDKAIEDAALSHLRLFWTNILACRPADTPGGPNRPPTPEEALQCFDRLAVTLELVKPKVIVLLGSVPYDIISRLPQNQWDRLMAVNPTSWCGIPHPSYIARMGGTKAAAYPGYVIQLQRAWDERDRKERVARGKIRRLKEATT